MVYKRRSSYFLQGHLQRERHFVLFNSNKYCLNNKNKCANSAIRQSYCRVSTYFSACLSKTSENIIKLLFSLKLSIFNFHRVFVTSKPKENLTLIKLLTNKWKVPYYHFRLNCELFDRWNKLWSDQKFFLIFKKKKCKKLK